MLVALATLVSLALPATALDAAAQDDPASTAVATTSDAADDEVTELPSTGRGYGIERSEQGSMAVEQMLITVVVLLGAAAFALGGVALLWGHERR